MTDTDALRIFVTTKGRPIAPPDFAGKSLADTHAHLDMLDDPALALARCAVAGVGFVVTLANVEEQAERTYKGVDGWLDQARILLDAAGMSSLKLPDIRIIVGSHPHDASKYDTRSEQAIREFARDPRTCGIGEVGLDYHYDNSPRDIQRDVFARQIRLAHELELPVCIHLREAHEDGAVILAREGVPEHGCVLHCFNLGPDVAQGFLDMGCHLSFAGPLTFKKAHDVREAATMAPHDKVLTETDCPFMAPEPFRGHSNEPALVVFTAATLADVWGVEPSECAAITLENARRIFDRGRDV